MNIRSIILSATIALTAIIPGDAAMARTSRCWAGYAGQQLDHVFCDVERRINANGHVVFDIDGLGTVVLWDDNTAEMIGENGRYNNNFIVRTHGNDVRLINLENEFNFIFRIQ